MVGFIVHGLNSNPITFVTIWAAASDVCELIQIKWDQFLFYFARPYSTV